MNRKPRIDWFEGFLLGILAVTLFIAYNYGWRFTYISAGHELGPSHIWGVATEMVVTYLLIVFTLYEFIFGKNAFQSITYALLGYFCQDSMIQVHWGFAVYLPQQLYGDTSLINTFFNVFYNPDVSITFFLVALLVLFHTGSFDALTRLCFHFSIDYEPHLDAKKLFLCSIVWAALFYYVFEPLGTVAYFDQYGPGIFATLLPFYAYVASSKRLNSSIIKKVKT